MTGNECPYCGSFRAECSIYNQHFGMFKNVVSMGMVDK